jgi:cadmium resistance protein CadD (predicted permease)
MLELVAFGVVLFVATNSDDLLTLISWFVDPRLAASQVLAGQYLGQLVILTASGLAAALALAIATPWIHLFGLLPFTIGIVRLAQLARPGLAADREPTSMVRGVAEVTGLTIASGGDNLGAYAPVFATRSDGDRFVVIVVALVMTGLWCGIGYVVAHHPRSRIAAHRWGRLLLPPVMIAVGLSILVLS